MWYPDIGKKVSIDDLRKQVDPSSDANGMLKLVDVVQKQQGDEYDPLEQLSLRVEEFWDFLFDVEGGLEGAVEEIRSWVDSYGTDLHPDERSPIMDTLHDELQGDVNTYADRYQQVLAEAEEEAEDTGEDVDSLLDDNYELIGFVDEIRQKVKAAIDKEEKRLEGLGQSPNVFRRSAPAMQKISDAELDAKIRDPRNRAAVERILRDLEREKGELQQARTEALKTPEQRRQDQRRQEQERQDRELDERIRDPRNRAAVESILSGRVAKQLDADFVLPAGLESDLEDIGATVSVYATGGESYATVGWRFADTEFGYDDEMDDDEAFANDEEMWLAVDRILAGYGFELDGDESDSFEGYTRADIKSVDEMSKNFIGRLAVLKNLYAGAAPLTKLSLPEGYDAFRTSVAAAFVRFDNDVWPDLLAELQQTRRGETVIPLYEPMREAVSQFMTTLWGVHRDREVSRPEDFPRGTSLRE